MWRMSSMSIVVRRYVRFHSLKNYWKITIDDQLYKSSWRILKNLRSYLCSFRIRDVHEDNHVNFMVSNYMVSNYFCLHYILSIKPKIQ